MDRIVFYNLWKGKESADLSHWYNTNIVLKIVTEDIPNEVVVRKAPNIHWVVPHEFERIRREQHDKVYLEIPTLFHVPVFHVEPPPIPEGVGVMMAVVEFDWLYYTKSEHARCIRFSPHDIRIENKMTDKPLWVEKYILPIWETLYQGRHTLHPFQKRLLVGFSKVAGEWRVVEELSPQCDWGEPITHYDLAEVSYHTSMSLPPQERQQLFWDNLRKGGLGYIETWLELLNQPHESMFPYLLQKIHLETQWYEDMPVYRWVAKKLLFPEELYHKETMLMKRMPPSYDAVRRKYLFSRILAIQDPASHRLFTHECTHYLRKITALDGAETGDVLSSTHDPDYVPSSSGLMVYPENPRWYLVNVRQVNYRILPNGTYTTIKNGQINPTYNGISKNEFYLMDRDTLKPVSPIRPMREDEVPGKREEELAIVGLEDVRLVPGTHQDIMFYCVTKSYSYSDAIRIMTGSYDVERAMFRDTKVIHPPYEENACEKNWTWCGPNRFIYRWHPVEIGSVDSNHRLVVDERIPSPSYFKEFRGSSPALVWRGLHFFAVHSYTNGENGRKYIHSMIVLDLLSPQHRVVAVSSPFCFENVQIEYTIGIDIYKGKFLFLYSTRDSTSRYVRIPLHHLLESMFYPNKQMELFFKTRIYQDLF